MLFGCDIVAGAFFVCIYKYVHTSSARLPCHSIWFRTEFGFVSFSFHLKRSGQTAFCSKVSSIFTFIWCGLHARLFYDFRRFCVLNVLHSVLNMVEWSRTHSLGFHQVWITNTLQASEFVCRTFAVSVQCKTFCFVFFFIFMCCYASNRSIVRPFRTHTHAHTHTQLNAHLLRRCFLSNRLKVEWKKGGIPFSY